MTKRILGLMALVLVGGVGVAACGSSTSTTTTTDTTTPAASMATTAEPTAAMAQPTTASSASSSTSAVAAKTLDTFVYEPNTWNATAGSTVTVDLDNTSGTQQHSWVLLKKETTPDKALTITDTDTGDQLYNQKVEAGQKSSGTFTAPTEPGDYLVICVQPGHAAGGMKGTLTVK
jgi:plastocyanin